MWMSNGYGMGTAGWVLMVLAWVALLALVVFAVVRLFLAGRSQEPRDHEGESREILDRRLTRGEITIEHYEQLRSTLDQAGRRRSQDEQPSQPPGRPADRPVPDRLAR